MPLTLLCVATYRKGDEFLREARRQGCRVLLVTDETLREADWPREAIDGTYYVRRDMPDADIRKGAAYLARHERLDRIVALDDFDVEPAAMLREHLNVPGLGQTAARGFRDKLAMRVRARAAGIACPDFVHPVNEEALREWTSRVAPPWVLKPRSQAAAIGIRRIGSGDELREALDTLADDRAEFLLERFVPGDVFHVDSLVFGGRVVFATASRYGMPPMAVAHEGGIFVTQTLDDRDPLVVALKELNARLLAAFGLGRGASHTEFIRAEDGRLRFLETSARVGGAYIVDVVAAATGVNLWQEWAKIEIAGDGGHYDPPVSGEKCAGIVLSLARQEWPDLSGYAESEIVQRVNKRHHAGLIVASRDAARVQHLLETYRTRFSTEFHASAPPPARATD
ncbi:MAG TPA: ATP-grasp domain-containing protein [Vicinamibacterales bacterium]|jgi:glutathione synthase/RimK-type ligase-like ATP-grasp enzyme